MQQLRHYVNQCFEACECTHDALASYTHPGHVGIPAACNQRLHRREAMRERHTGTARSQRLLRPTTSQVLLLVLLAAGVIAGVQQRKAAVRPLVVS